MPPIRSCFSRHRCSTATKPSLRGKRGGRASLIDDIDAGSQRLLPLLASQLRGFGVDHADLKRYDSVARYFWG